MGWLIAALGTGLAIGGTLAIYFGAPYIQLEWGYSEVIAGTTALSAGILAVALAAILFALRDLKRIATVDVSGAPTAGGTSSGAITRTDVTLPAPALAPAPVEAAAERIEASSRDDAPEPPRPVHGGAPPVDQAPTVVGRYEANGASYVLFSDGTIEVETEMGTHRYGSMQELRAEIERQGTG